jgi:tetratricopeptide (TPR) repeat protein
MQHLINAGAASQAARLATADAIGDKSVTDAYIEALIAMSDRKNLGPVIRQAAENEDDPVRLRRLGRIALESEQTDAARSAFQKLLSLRPDDREALKRNGALALWEGNFSDARRLLGRLAKLGDADYEAHFYLGEVLHHDHDSGARAQYDRALELLPQDTAVEVRIVRAELLQRLGRTAEALTAFESVLQERPGDNNTRAEYATTLLQAGRYDDAKRIVAAK